MPDYPDYPSIQERFRIPQSTNKRQSRINSQTSLKQHLPPTTSAHQLKGSHRRSMKTDSLRGRRVPRHTAFSFPNRWHWHKENVRRCCAVSTKLLRPLIWNSGTMNQPAAMQRSLRGEAAITSATEWSACYITSQAWPQEWREKEKRSINNKLGKPKLLKTFCYHRGKKKEQQISTSPVDCLYKDILPQWWWKL